MENQRIPYDDLRVALVLGCELRPDAGILGIAGTTLSDDLVVPASVVVLED